MPKIITKTVYSLEELKQLGNDRAVEKAREWLRQGACDYEWWEYTYEMWTDALKQIGFENAKIAFSGFSSQGDGASFTADVDKEALITFLSNKIEPSDSVTFDGKAEDYRGFIVNKCGGGAFNPKFSRLLWIIDDLSFSVYRTSHHYSHEGTCAFGCDSTIGDRHPRTYRLHKYFVLAAEELRRDLCQAIYKSLEEEYEYLNSNEQIDESAAANEYTFDEDGNRDG